MSKETKLNIIIGLLIVVFLMQVFLKPVVNIEDNHLGIQYEVKTLTEQIEMNEIKTDVLKSLREELVTCENNLYQVTQLEN